MHLKLLYSEYPVIDSFEVRLHRFATSLFSTFFILSACELWLLRIDSASKEVDQVLQNSSIFLETGSIEEIQHGSECNYYGNLNWLYTLLCISISLSGFPRKFWKLAEGGLVESLTKFINAPHMSNRSQEYHEVMLEQYLMETHGKHGFYFLECILAEFFTLVAAICQTFLIKSVFCLKISKYAPKMSTHWNFPAWCISFLGCEDSCTNVSEISVLGTRFEYIVTLIYFAFLVLFFIVMNILVFLLIRRIYSVFHPEGLVDCRKSYRESLTSKYQVSDWFLLDLLKRNMDPYEFKFVVNELEIDLSKKYE